MRGSIGSIGEYNGFIKFTCIWISPNIEITFYPNGRIELFNFDETLEDKYEWWN